MRMIDSNPNSSVGCASGYFRPVREHLGRSCYEMELELRLAREEQLPEERTSKRSKSNKKKQKHSRSYENNPFLFLAIPLLLLLINCWPGLAKFPPATTTTTTSTTTTTNTTATTTRPINDNQLPPATTTAHTNINDNSTRNSQSGFVPLHVRLERNNNLDDESPLADQQPTTTELNGDPSDTPAIPSEHATTEANRRPEAIAKTPGHRKQQQQQQPRSQPVTSKRNALHRVSDSELLPLSEFNVQQPPFSELIKSWPPTSLQQLGRESHGVGLGNQLASQRQQQQAAAKGRLTNMLWGGGTDEEPEVVARNHLNEDLDDTIVTADESFERDQLEEPSTWVNYLGEMGDYVYAQLRQHLLSESSIGSSPNRSQPQQTGLKLEQLDELLDDFYYDQYENSQVLYYGPQLVREGDIFEIGCYMPKDQPAEWTKSGRPLEEGNKWPRVIRRNDFLGAKQNFSLKVFEAALTDTGNYRCNRMSRKFHKLVVVPVEISSVQLYLVQQQLLSVVKPEKVTLPGSTLSAITAATYKKPGQRQIGSRKPTTTGSKAPSKQQRLPAGQLIVENHPLTLDCNITDESLLRRLRESPHFRLAWFKNGRQLRGAGQLTASVASAAQPLASAWPPSRQSAAGNTGGMSRRKASGQVQAQAGGGSGSAVGRQVGRIQFSGQNGRQLQILSAQFNDAGDYLCSWYQLPSFGRDTNEEPAGLPEDTDQRGGPGEEQGLLSPGLSEQHPGQSTTANPLAAGNLLQLMAPVKLRPFKSTYHVRQNNELRLVCLAQQAHPAAQISWYFGNRLVDGEFLRENSNDFRLLSLSGEGQFYTSGPGSPEPAPTEASSNQESEDEEAAIRQIVEINPIPSNKQQMHLTADGRGTWLEYKDFALERNQINTPEQQQKYLQIKLGQLTSAGSSSSLAFQMETSGATPASGSGRGAPKTSLSILVISKLNVDRHSARFACRATTRANTDEVTTVIRVQGSSVVLVRPSSGRATLVYGQPLHFQCDFIGRKNVNFLWFKRRVGFQPGDYEDPIQPDEDGIELHNDRLTVQTPDRNSVGDYVCRLKNERLAVASQDEFAVIKVRSSPYIDDFNLKTSGKSYTLTDGERLELLCSVRDRTSPVNITWLKSQTPDDERTMVPLASSPPSQPEQRWPNGTGGPQTFLAPDQSSILVEEVDEFSKRLVIEAVKLEHRSYYVCMADNGVTERTRKVIFVRVKDKFIALWPFLGIVSEVFILFTIIHSWETFSMYQRVPTT